MKAKGVLATIVCGLLGTFAVSAGAVDTQASMAVTGTIKVNADDGHVVGYQLDDAADLPDGAMHVLTRTVPEWEFKPVDLPNGKRILASEMQVRLVAKPNADDTYAVSVENAWFGSSSARADNDAMLSKEHSPTPAYPSLLDRWGVEGTVHLVMHIDEDGNVDKVAAQRVDPRTRGKPGEMDRWRNELAKSSVRAAQDWTYKVPTEGARADQDGWEVSLPVRYQFDKRGDKRGVPYGKWVTYIPGPDHDIAWLDDDKQDEARSAASLEDGSAHLLSQSKLHLKSGQIGL